MTTEQFLIRYIDWSKWKPAIRHTISSGLKEANLLTAEAIKKYKDENPLFGQKSTRDFRSIKGMGWKHSDILVAALEEFEADQSGDGVFPAIAQIATMES